MCVLRLDSAVLFNYFKTYVMAEWVCRPASDISNQSGRILGEKVSADE